MRNTSLFLCFILIGCGGTATPAPAPTQTLAVRSAGTEPMLGQDRLLPNPLSTYSPAVQRAWGAAKQGLDIQFPRLDQPLPREQAEAWTSRYEASLQQFSEAFQAAEPALVNIEVEGPDQQLFSFVLRAALRERIFVATDPLPNPFADAQDAADWRQGYYSAAGDAASLLRDQTVMLYGECESLAPRATLSDWGPRCGAARAGLHEVVAYTPPEVPIGCRNDIPGAPGDLAFGFPTPSTSSPASWYVVLHDQSNTLDQTERAQITDATLAWLNQNGHTTISRAEFEQYQASAIANPNRCARQPSGIAPLISAHSRVGQFTVLTSVTPEGVPVLIGGQFPVGALVIEGLPIQQAEMRGSVTEVSAWVDAISRLQPVASGPFVGVQSLAELGQARAQEESTNSNAEVMMRVTHEVMGALPRTAFEDATLQAKLGGCLNRTELLLVPVEVEISANGAPTSVNVNDGNSGLQPQQLACLAQAISEASFACPMSGQAETLQLNLCVR